MPYDPAIGPLIDVSFTQAGVLSSEEQGRSIPGRFLIDTGASITSLSPHIIERVGLRSLGKIPVSVPAGQASLNTYLVDLLVIFGDASTGFPHADRIPTYPASSLFVMEYLGSREHFDGLLGRDILNLGTLKTDGPSKLYTLILPDVEDSISVGKIQHE